MIQDWKDTLALLKLRLLADKRSKQSLSSAILYMISTCLLAYFSFPNASNQVWSVMFWIILLFSAINTVSTHGNARNSFKYSYILSTPLPIILSQLLHHIIHISLLALIELAFFAFLVELFTHSWLYLGLVMGTGVIAISGILTMLASLANQSQSSAAMVTILGCPIMLPCLINLTKLTEKLSESELVKLGIMEVAPTVALAVTAITSTLMLYTYIWRE